MLPNLIILFSDCRKSDWPINVYDVHSPPYRLLSYNFISYYADPFVVLNLTLAMDLPIGDLYLCIYRYLILFKLFS